jgi:hypothetical protein
VAVGTLEDMGVPRIVAASKEAADFEARIHQTLLHPVFYRRSRRMAGVYRPTRQGARVHYR